MREWEQQRAGKIVWLEDKRQKNATVGVSEMEWRTKKEKKLWAKSGQLCLNKKPSRLENKRNVKRWKRNTTEVTSLTTLSDGDKRNVKQLIKTF